ncbi:9624_t:CDS:2, partial [Diversispora eburnea]
MDKYNLDSKKHKQITKQFINKEEEENNLETVEFYFENGLRKVKPYYYEYKTFAKGRWIKKNILNVFRDEFRDRTKEYYETAIEKGLIMINNKIVTPSTIIQNQDLITHKIHRHEPPITDKKIKILYQENDFIVIDKPASIPIHPSGRYRHNTVLHILQKEHGFLNLFPLNRLDRLTSGIVILSLNKKKAREFEQLMTKHKIQKEYICQIKCDQPIKLISHKLGLNLVHPDGKSCITIFKRISYNGSTSLVKCKPLTGRTHQIRVHLQYLGHPIVNDPLYCNIKSWGPDIGKGGIDINDDKKINELVNSISSENDFDNKIDNLNNECTISHFSDPKPNQLLIWLHAV